MWIIEEGPGIISRVSNQLSYRRLVFASRLQESPLPDPTPEQLQEIAERLK